jgi:Squalene-hopene cyclase C-terminal domain
MRTVRRLLAVAASGTVAGVFALGAAGPSSAATPHVMSTVPQASAARAAAQWLAGQFGPSGFIPVPGGSNPDYSSTAQSVLALAAGNVDPVLAHQALSFLAANVGKVVPQPGGADGPGQLAILILDATALGENPRQFGGYDLVARLLATQQTSGPDAGLFGTEDQVTNFSAGTFQQGLALAALAGAGVQGTAPVESAVSWLVGQQCPDGGWTGPDTTANACNGDPANFAGPDTNSTALAIDGLAAQGSMAADVRAKALGFLTAVQNPDAGWPFFPGSAAAPQASDPDSTALVIQSFIAVGVSPDDPGLAKGADRPVSTLLTFQQTSGADRGAFGFSPAPSPANVIATYQAIPTLAGVVFPFGPSGGSYWLTGADGGIFAFGHAGYFGSLPGLGIGVSDIRAIVGTADGGGYWLTGADGGVFGFGDAPFLGSLPGLGVNVADIVATVATDDGGGYWMIGADGGVFAFGDAGFVGSLPGIGVHVANIVGAVPTADGGGYWLVGSDGGVFAFGDAGFVGSLPALGITTSDIVGITPTADGAGYWIAGADGGVFAFGDADFVGSLPGLGVVVSDVVGIAPTADAGGYYLASRSGGVFAFGDAVFSGSAATAGATDIVGIAVSPVRQGLAG